MQSEHSPNPQKSRGVYGFVMYMFFVLFIIIYIIWLLIPTSVTKTWEYEPPQKYWALAIPIFFCTALFLFAFCIYPATHSLLDGELNELSAIQDCHSISSTHPLNEIPLYDEPLDEDALQLPHPPPRKRKVGKGTKNNDKKSDKIINLKLYDDSGSAKIYPKRKIHSASDLDLEQVCKLLYLGND